MATSSTNVGLWDAWYYGLTAPEAYAQTATYRLGAEWLADCPLVEDWGCGKGWLSTLIEPGRYRGIDGSQTPYADVVADLAAYRSQTPGLFMRHVLEHDYRWREILDNALASFTQRMVLVLFTPPAEKTGDIEFEDPPGVPNIAFRLEDLTDRMTGVTFEHETIASPSKYGTETIFWLRRP